MLQAAKSDAEVLLDELGKGLLARFQGMAKEEKAEFWSNLTPSEFKNFSELLLRMRPIDVDLEKNVLSLSKSLEGLPEIPDLMAENALLRKEIEKLTLDVEIYRKGTTDFKEQMRYVFRSAKIPGDWIQKLFDWTNEFVDLLDHYVNPWKRRQCAEGIVTEVLITKEMFQERVANIRAMAAEIVDEISRDNARRKGDIVNLGDPMNLTDKG